MQYTLLYSARAIRNLKSIHRYITNDSSRARADRFEQQIRNRCERLCLMPLQGVPQPGIGADARVAGLDRRVAILFRVEQNTVRILSIAYAGRTLQKDNDD